MAHDIDLPHHDSDVETMDSRLSAHSPFDNNSLHVQAGSPRSPLPIELRRIPTERIPQPDTLLVSDDDDEEDDDVGGKDESFAEKDGENQDRNYRFTLDPEGELTHDITTVDVVTVPCPGAHPLRAWNREGLLSRYFGAPSMRDAEGHDPNQASNTSWVRQGIRREANKARILLYNHPEMPEGTSLNTLANAFLESLLALRIRENQSRPLFFLGHSIGGLIVKLALVKASRDNRYESILREAYGVAFFGTPHQGSSYFAMPSLSGSIQSLLQLSTPLPDSICLDLAVGNAMLAHVDEDFKDMASDLRIWTFYETIDSRLSGGIAGDASAGDVYFTAPLTSVKSAILGMRQERIFPLQSDHANVASFGRHNSHTLQMFLDQLAAQISKADHALSEGSHWTSLNLEQKVHVEVHGFFDDVVVGGGSATVRAWSTRLPLREFLKKGPDVCLNERLNEVIGEPEPSRFLRERGRTSIIRADRSGGVYSAPAASAATPIPPILSSTPEVVGIMTVKDALGIRNSGIGFTPSPPPPMSPIIRPIDAQVSPQGAVSASPHWSPPSFKPSPASRRSLSIARPSPWLRAQYEQDFVVNKLSPPMRARRTARSLTRSLSLGSDGIPRFEFRDFPRFSPRSKSIDDQVIIDDDDDDDDEDNIEASPKLPESLVGMTTVFSNANQREQETMDIDPLPAIFSKPDTKARKFVWIHLPFNNPSWVKSMLQTLQVCYGKDLSPVYGSDFWAIRHTKGRHAQHYAYFAKPGCHFTAPRSASRNHSVASLSVSPAARDDGMYTTLFFPYLHFDSYKRLIRRRDLIIKRLRQGRARPIPEEVAKSESLECQVIWEHLGQDPPLNCRRTLDQFGYPSLRDTRSRDDDQMLYKLTKERQCDTDPTQEFKTQTSTTGSSVEKNSISWRDRLNWRDRAQPEATSEDVLNGNVLMVDQLWLWVINSHTVLTFFPKRESDPIEGPLFQQADLRDSIFNEVNVDLARQCENAFDLAALSVLHAVTVLLDGSSHPDLEVFRIFEEAISVLTEKLTSSMKDFREEGVRDKTFDYDAAETKTRFIRARHREEGRRAEEENRNNTSALLELRDIEDELIILLHLFERQAKVISSMHAIYARADLREQTINGRAFLNEALKKVAEYIHQADEMIRRVRNTRDDYDKLLQMVQRQAQVDEVRLSRLHADVASAQSRSVLIFTTFTVIFLPLTFFTGLFGMNTQEWGGQNNLSLTTIGSIAIPASLFLIVTSLVIAWSTRAHRFLRMVGRIIAQMDRAVYILVWRPIVRFVLRKVGLTTRRVGEIEERDGTAQATLTQEVSDFWERHRLERDRGYKIPDVNRKSGAIRVGWRGKKDGRSKQHLD